MNAQELESALQNFTGTEQYHRIGLSKTVVATDGVAFLAKEAKAYWLTDIVASYQGSILRSSDPKCAMLREFQVWTLRKNKTGSGAKIVCTDGNTDESIFSQRIEYTDFPMQEVKIWVQPQDALMVMMLPSEN